MEIYETHSHSVVIVEPRGRIDSTTAREFSERLQVLLANGESRLVVDLSHVAYISSAGFRALLLAAKRSDEIDGRLTLCGLGGELKRLFDLGAFTDLFVICSSREESVRQLA